MNTELHFSPVLKARAEGEKHFQGDLAALPVMFLYDTCPCDKKKKIKRTYFGLDTVAACPQILALR